jgi:hypothetical protein
MFKGGLHRFDVYLHHNGSWIEMKYADLSKAALVKQRFEETGMVVTTFEGNITFRGVDYNRLSSLEVYALPQIRITKNGHAYYSGLLNLLGEWNTATHECSLPVIGNDVVSKLIKVYNEKIEVFIPSIHDMDVRMSLRGEVREIHLNEATGTPPTALNNWVFDRTESYGSNTLFRHFYKKALIPKYSGVLVPQPVHEWEDDETQGVESDNFPRYSGYYSKATADMPYYRIWKRGFKTLAQVMTNMLEGYMPQTGLNIPDLYLDNPLVELPDGLDYDMENVLVADNKYLHTEVATLPWSANQSPLEIDYSVRSAYSLKDIADALLAYFNLVLCLREQGGSYYLSFRYYSKINPVSVGTSPYHNLTTLFGVNWSTPKYAFRKENMVYREIFESVARRPDWNGEDAQNQITYPVLLNYSDEEKKHPCGLIRTNIQDVAEGRVTDGICFVLWQTGYDGYRYIQTAAGILSEVHETNQIFSLSQVLRDYHSSGRRVIPGGKIGDEENTFTQTLKNNQTDVILAPVGAGDMNFNHLVKTDLGKGELVEVKEHFDGRYSEVRLNF